MKVVRLLVREISSENHPVDRIFTVSTRWISHNFFRILCESPLLSELISVSSGRIDFKIVLNQSYGCILSGKNCFGTVPSPQDVDKKFGKKSWTLFPKSPTTSLQREIYNTTGKCHEFTFTKRLASVTSFHLQTV